MKAGQALVMLFSPRVFELLFLKMRRECGVSKTSFIPQRYYRIDS